MDLQIKGVFGFLFFVLAVWAIYKIVNSSATTTTKVVWIVVILLLPLAGLIAWFFAGPKG